MSNLQRQCSCRRSRSACSRPSFAACSSPAFLMPAQRHLCIGYRLQSRRSPPPLQHTRPGSCGRREKRRSWRDRSRYLSTSGVIVRKFWLIDIPNCLVIPWRRFSILTWRLDLAGRSGLSRSLVILVGSDYGMAVRLEVWV